MSHKEADSSQVEQVVQATYIAQGGVDQQTIYVIVLGVGRAFALSIALIGCLTKLDTFRTVKHNNK